LGMGPNTFKLLSTAPRFLTKTGCVDIRAYGTVFQARQP
jgi:hypothetical protein